MLKNIYFLWINLSWLTNGAWAQRSLYSLQTAVDAVKFPLNAPPSQPNYYRSALATASDQDYWDDDFNYPVKSNRHRPFNDIFDDEPKKRSSSFRQQYNNYNNRNDNEPSSIFRERETQTTNGNSELTEEFLREIEEAQEREREQRYKNALRHLWEKYQTQNNDVDNELFNEKKRMRVPPYYMLMSKKRSYPVLPWLPYNNDNNNNNNDNNNNNNDNNNNDNKRFPAVTKRSTKRASNGNVNDFDKTDERVERELSEMFGITKSETKKKRSTDDKNNNNQEKLATTNKAPGISTSANQPIGSTKASESSTTNKPDKSIDENKKSANHQHTTHGHDNEHEHKHKKRSNGHHSVEDEHIDSEEEEEEEDDSEEHEHGDEHDDEEDDDEFGDEEDEERKKKRDLTSSNRKNSDIIKRKKKSIEWSKYFGIDRKKKSPLADMKMKKRSASDFSNYMDDDNPKRSLSSDKINNMDKKLQTIEDLIIDETIKYTGSHEGITNPIEIRRLKDHVLSRLATAYSLEKMRLALEKLRQSVDNENHLLRNVIEPEFAEDENDSMENIKNGKPLSM